MTIAQKIKAAEALPPAEAADALWVLWYGVPSGSEAEAEVVAAALRVRPRAEALPAAQAAEALWSLRWATSRGSAALARVRARAAEAGK